jgi:hypothetical protein
VTSISGRTKRAFPCDHLGLKRYGKKARDPAGRWCQHRRSGEGCASFRMACKLLQVHIDGGAGVTVGRTLSLGVWPSVVASGESLAAPAQVRMSIAQEITQVMIYSALPVSRPGFATTHLPARPISLAARLKWHIAIPISTR